MLYMFEHTTISLARCVTIATEARCDDCLDSSFFEKIKF
jgi:endonuclease III